MDRNKTRLIELFEKDLEADFFKDQMTDFISDKLLPHQIMHVQNLIFALTKNRVILDGSSVGTGKTYVSLATCKHFNLQVFIICPKSIINIWRKLCKYFDLAVITVVNYETIRKCKMYASDHVTRINCPYLAYDVKQKTFNWRLPPNSIIIFDEAHHCKDKSTLNAQLLLSTVNMPKVMMLSATIADQIDNFHVFGLMLGFYKTMKQSKNWITYIKRDIASNKTKKSKTLSNLIFPEKGSRMKISDLKNFPQNQISADCYDLDQKLLDRVDLEYAEIKKLLKTKTQDKKQNENILVKMMRARQKIELLKIPIILDLTRDYNDAGYSVVIFINFKQTMKILMEHLNTKCIIHGGQTLEKRDSKINSFQTNKERVIICNVQAGGEAISLHDLEGKHPRVSLINPSFSGINLVQCLGRISRAGAKSPALQRIIYTTSKIEEMICQNIKKKLKFIDQINDGDLKLDDIQ